MDTPISDVSTNHQDSSSTGGRTTPPNPTTSPPQNMIPGPAHPFSIAPSGRTPGSATTLPPIRSPVGFKAPLYNHPYTTSSTSPSTTSGSLQEPYANDVSSFSAPGVSPSQISSSSLNAQKRAYRQRRKDPSCDACRERKVKCDATETTACSECSSRNHKCQFTKETNRRMSSIKQVQDLQSRVAELTQENTHLRTRVSDRGASEPTRGTTFSQRQDNQIQSPTIPRKLPALAIKNAEHIRNNIKIHSRGIFDLTSQFQHVTTPIMGAPSFPDMPPRSDFAHLSRSYLVSIHELFPILHWPTFQHEIDQVYTARSFEGKSREWIGLFFAVMACGTLHAPNAPKPSIGSKATDLGSVYFGIATQAIDPFPEAVTTSHTCLALLLSVFATESNMKSVGAIWLSAAVRLAQLLRLHSESDGPVVEGEMRRRLWWSIYTWDRISSLAANLPMSIDENDCDVMMPSSLEDRYIQPQGFARQPTYQPPFSGFVAMIQVARLFPHLQRALKSVVVQPQTLQNWDERFHSTLILFPESYQLSSDAPLEPEALSPIIALHAARFLLYRCNISPACPPPDRTEAMRRCTLVALDTAKYISRTLHTSSGAMDRATWQTKAVQLASNMICTHLWRCILMLCFRTEYEAALMCLRLSSAIGHTRKINVACGRNLTFFLDGLLERMRSGDAGYSHLEHDEEIIVYVSGDMQGSWDHSWLGTGTDLATASPLSPPSTGAHIPYSSDEPMQGTKITTDLTIRPTPESPDNGTRDWDGWARVERLIHQLMEEHVARLAQAHQAQPTPYYPPPHNPVKRLQLAPDTPASPTQSAAAPPPTPSSTSRISIANII